MSKVVSFFNDVKLELNKVSWPTWDDLKSSTYVVLNLSLILIASIQLKSQHHSNN